MAERVPMTGDRSGSIHAARDPSKCRDKHNGVWRTVKCTGDIDVIECSQCGEQREAKGDFDDEYS
jgi:hypothetical protein